MKRQGGNMKLSTHFKTSAAMLYLLFGIACAHAEEFNIPGGDLKTALEIYTRDRAHCSWYRATL